MVGRRSRTPEQWGTSSDPRMEYHDTGETHCWNLFSGVPRQQGRPPRGHPLGGGHPETVPQDFKEQFHSAREDASESDDVYDSSGDEEEDPDDIIEYNTEHSRFSTVSDRERHQKCARHRANYHSRRERDHHHGRGGPLGN